MNRKPKKAVPTTPKTTGDYIRLGRYEKGLNLTEMAAKLAVPISLLNAWENDAYVPHSEQWKVLANLLCLPSDIMKPTNPT